MKWIDKLTKLLATDVTDNGVSMDIVFKQGKEEDICQLRYGEIAYISDKNYFIIGLEETNLTFDQFDLIATNMMTKRYRYKRALIGLNQEGVEEFKNRITRGEIEMNIVHKPIKHNAKAGDIIVLKSKEEDIYIHYLIVEDRSVPARCYTIVNLTSNTLLSKIKTNTADELVDKVIDVFKVHWTFKSLVKSDDVDLQIK